MYGETFLLLAGLDLKHHSFKDYGINTGMTNHNEATLRLWNFLECHWDGGVYRLDVA